MPNFDMDFSCVHGYAHYSDCPLCGKFPYDTVAEIERIFEDSITMQDKIEIADYVTSYVYR